MGRYHLNRGANPERAPGRLICRLVWSLVVARRRERPGDCIALGQSDTYSGVLGGRLAQRSSPTRQMKVTVIPNVAANAKNTETRARVKNGLTAIPAVPNTSGATSSIADATRPLRCESENRNSATFSTSEPGGRRSILESLFQHGLDLHLHCYFSLWGLVPPYMVLDHERSSMAPDLDNVDRGILHLLQLDARNTTAQEIADKTGVAASTVRNRIDQLEVDGVITGYHPTIDYEAADLPLEVMFVISAPPTERAEAVENIMDIKGVVDVRETLTGRCNVYVEAVGTSTSDISRMTGKIHDLGLEIESSKIVKQRQVQPFNHFHFEGELVGDKVEDDSE